MSSSLSRIDQFSINTARLIRQNVHVDKLNPRLCFNMKKSDILKCPNKYYYGKIYVISSEKDERNPEIIKAVEKLSISKCLGFDTETAVDWKQRSNNNPVSLVQLACKDIAVLWRLRKNENFLRDKFPASLKSILRNPNVRKVGTASVRDVIDLYSHYDVAVSNIIDNQSIAKEIGLSRVGLSSMTSQLFGWSISKARRLSNWEASFLDRSQAIYAATDAWASLLVYEQLESMILTISGGPPMSLPSADEQKRAHESNVDLKLFRALDTKVMQDRLPRSELRTLFQNKHERLMKRKFQKVNATMDDMDVDFIESLWKEIVKMNSPSEHLNVETGPSFNSFMMTFRKKDAELALSEIPFLYKSGIR